MFQTGGSSHLGSAVYTFQGSGPTSKLLNPMQMLGALSIWLLVSSGGIVIRDPAPYELFAAAIMPIWFLAGLPIPRSILPVFLLLIAYVLGGVIAISQVKIADKAPMFVAVTGFLAVTTIFFASLIADNFNRLKLISNGMITAACITVFLAIMGYFSVFPGAAELFTLYSRAKGGFEDPNVYGPFLMFPIAILLYDLLNGNRIVRPIPLAVLLWLLFGAFLSFSRATWGLTIFVAGSLFLVSYVNARDAKKRFRLIAILGFGILMSIALLGVMLSFDVISSLFEERAQLVQNYDGGRLGRFARQALGFKLILDHPLGLGALEFGRYHFPGDPHNVYLKSFTAYGWIGGIVYPIMVIWTIARAFPLLFKPRPWQGVLVAAFVVLIGHQIVAIVIDVDHWRHYFLLLGIIWGIIALESKRSQNPGVR